MERPQSVERAIEALAVRQYGVFARVQAVELGASRNIIENRIASGAWPLVLPRVHRFAVVASSPPQAAMAAALWSAPDGLVSHQTAAILWRFEAITHDKVHITLPMRRNLRSTKVKVHHTVDLIAADIGMMGPIAVTSALRTAIDLAAVVDVDTLEIAIESALRRGLFTVGQLQWRSDALLGTGRAGSASLRASSRNETSDAPTAVGR